MVKINEVGHFSTDFVETFSVEKNNMLEMEGFDPDAFRVVEYPAPGVYCCNYIHDGKYFIIQEYEGTLSPYYTTWEMNEEGINNFPCESIEESISLTEC